MKLNVNSRFSQSPFGLDMKRSKFSRNHDHKTTFNNGEIVPLYLSEILPGDSVDLTTNFVCRMSTPIFPVMDNAYIDFSYFFVPNRLIMDKWEALNGQNDETFWTVPTEYQVPFLKAPQGGWDKGSLADYMGVPTNVNNIEVSALPFRAYVKIWNDWFRDQNNMNPAYFVTDESDRQGKRRDSMDDTPLSALESALYGGRPLNAAKFHDYFTSAFPQPQKHDPVSVAINGSAPVIPGEAHTSVYEGLTGMETTTPISFNTNGGGSDPIDFLNINSDGDLVGMFDESGVLSSMGAAPGENGTLTPNNLWMDSSYGSNDFYGSPSNPLSTMSVLISDLRTAFQLQKIFEKDAFGTRYIEQIYNFFGVTSPDGRLQRSEYLGGFRQAINMSQVLQSSASNDVSPQGNASGFSMTNGSSRGFVKSFTEHGWIIGLAVVRTRHTYQQGINRHWSRRRRFDFYLPTLAHISEQPILKKEIFATGEVLDSDTGEIVYDYDNQAFGYQEAWADYRYHPSIVSGAFRSNVQGSLDAWHYADYYTGSNEDFVIDADFLFETPHNLDRTLAVQSELEDQFIMDYQATTMWTRVMPLYSVPGMVDHF